MDVCHAAQEIVVSVETLGGLALGAVDLGLPQPWRDCAHDTCGHLILQIEDVFKPTFEAVSPQMYTSRSFHKLTGDAQSAGDLPHAAFKHVAHSQLAPDLSHVYGSILVSEA